MKKMKKNDHEIKYSSEKQNEWYGIRKRQQIKYNTIEFRFQHRREKSDSEPKRIWDVNANH